MTNGLLSPSSHSQWMGIKAVIFNKNKIINVDTRKANLISQLIISPLR